MKLVLRDLGSEILVSNAVFGVAFNESLVHQVVVSYRLSLRQGTCAQKNRSEVSGSGKKPWRQKGTGRARSGSKRSPLWRSGGVTFASKPKSYKVKVNKKMYRGALKSILSELIRQNRLLLVSAFSLEKPKTKILIQELKKVDLVDNVLFLLDKVDRNLFLASRNLYKVKVCSTNNINPYILISFKKIIMTMNAIKNIEDMLI